MSLKIGGGALVLISVLGGTGLERPKIAEDKKWADELLIILLIICMRQQVCV